MEKILIVEDDYNLGIMVKDILELYDYDAIILRKPKETVENILNNKVTLVIMDKLMSGIDGTDVCTEIRKTQVISKIPVLMMSALIDARKSCLDAGATDFIHKPFEIEDLLGKVKTLLNL